LQKVGEPLDQLMLFYRTTQNAKVTYGLIRTTTAELPQAGGDATRVAAPVLSAAAATRP
jgi:hypothetical protein